MASMEQNWTIILSFSLINGPLFALERKVRHILTNSAVLIRSSTAKRKNGTVSSSNIKNVVKKPTVFCYIFSMAQRDDGTIDN